MSYDPPPAQRDWHATNNETDARFGTGHRPYPRRAGYHWHAGCACECDRGEDAITYQTWELAYDASHINLAAAEHGDPT